MGTLQTYKCSSCAYSALIGGGQTVGMSSVQWTIRCYECADLIDVLVSEEPWNTPENWKPEAYSCPNDADHRVELWSEGAGCPRCSGLMSVDEAASFVLWD